MLHTYAEANIHYNTGGSARSQCHYISNIGALLTTTATTATVSIFHSLCVLQLQLDCAPETAVKPRLFPLPAEDQPLPQLEVGKIQVPQK